MCVCVYVYLMARACVCVHACVPKALFPEGNGQDVLLTGIAKREGVCACARSVGQLCGSWVRPFVWPCNTLLHCHGAAGSGSPATHCRIALG